MTEDKELQVSDLEKLTPQNKLFLTYILDGKSTVEAYTLAGYEGDNHAAYTMRTRLNKALEVIAEAKGVDKAGLLVKIGSLLEKPLVFRDQRGMEHEVKGLTVNEHLKALSIQKDLILKGGQSGKSKITAIQINRYEEGKAKVTEAEVIVQEAPQMDTALDNGQTDSRE